MKKDWDKGEVKNSILDIKFELPVGEPYRKFM